ncbi:ABC transporter ATP-binding protein/permease [Microbacterium suaedae]|uniref:ABC transporter ATP-binding protein/permease n=1 Tax=Microbacterium suaedae TaxID=2067813 RepID=UPI0013A6367A|nr:ABC transporter ATP-binding protein/permease [Microbacterium suaedae]
MREVKLSRVSRVYGTSPTVIALDGIELTIGQGEFVAIQGESGGGKSTLLNILGLLDTPTGGDYFLGGQAVSDVSAGQLPLTRSDSFAYVFQAFHILEQRPAVESVELSMLYRGISTQVRRDRALDALTQVGIDHLAYTVGRNLSGGQRQRVAVARALASRAPVLLADEPTGNLDSRNTQAVMECLERVHRTGATVVLVTHSQELAARADRRIQVADGKIVADSGQSSPVAPPPPAPDGEAGRVRLRHALADVWANVTSRIGRTSGLVAAVAVAIALAVATSGLAFSAQAQVSDTFNAAESTDVFMQWDELTGDTGTAESIVQRLAALNGVTAAGVVSHHDARTVSASPVRPPLMAPVLTYEGQLEAARLGVEWPAAPRKTLGDGEALVGRNLADQLQLPTLPTTPVIEVDGAPLSVVGIIDTSPRAPEWLGGVVTTTTSEIRFADRTISVTALVTTATGAANQVSREAPLAIDPFAPDRLVVKQPTDPNSLRATIEGSVQASLIVLTVVAMLGSIASVTLATLAAVAERRGEIGLRRALGARRRDIWSMLTLEATAIGVSGGMIGVLLGLGAILAVTIARHWTPIFDARLGLAAIFAGALIGIVGALAGAMRAVRIAPSEALRPGN